MRRRRTRTLWSYAGPDYAVDGGMLSGEYYILRDVPVDAIKVTEGSLFIAERKDFPSLAEECSPSVTASLEQFFNRVDRATLVGLSMLYQTLRSVSDNHVHLICGVEEAFADLPDHVRHLGPWQVMSRGEIYKLKPEYRRALARDGYYLVKCELAVFKPEV